MRSSHFAAAALVLCSTLSIAQTPPNPNPNPNPAPTPTPTPAPAPAPAPRFDTGSPLDGLRNQAWSKLQEMTDAYEKCDPARFERALNELEQLRRDAKAAAATARGSAEFSTVKPEEADGLAEAIRGMIEPRRYLLADLKRECAREHRPGGIGRIFGPRPDSPAQPATGTAGPSGTPAQPLPPPPCPTQPQPQAQPSPPVESILDDIEEMERWEKEQKKAARDRAQAQPAQGLSQADSQAIAQQQATIDSFEADLAELKKLLREGRIDEAHELVDDLDDWLDWLEGRPGPFGTSLKRPAVPQRMIDEWDRRIDDIIDEFLKLPAPRFQLSPTSSRILDMHNQTRVGLGLAPMHWDYQLACQALSYGPTLAQYDRPVHSPRTGRESSRENLLQALPGTPVDRMVDVWISERRNFVPGIFPDVSRTGNWADVGHFTQIVWPTTTSVGCGVQRGIGRFDWLICRYAPPGNRDGTPVFADNGQPVLADDSGVAAPDSSTPTLPRLDPREMARMKVGGGMTQIDPPPPPPPTARDDAPDGDESRHPLVAYANAADAQHAVETDCGNTVMARLELDKMRYALDELRKRLKAARQAGQFSAVRSEDVQRQIDRLEQKIREAEQRRPRPRCPIPPPPPPPPPLPPPPPPP